jgi:hypothetical protein
MLRDATRIVNVVERAAAVLRGTIALQFRQTALIPQLHREADDAARLLLQDGGYGGGIHSAGHGYGDEAGLRFRADGQSLELCFREHCFYFIGLAWVALQSKRDFSFHEPTDSSE